MDGRTARPIHTSATDWRFCSPEEPQMKTGLHTKWHNGIGDVYKMIADEILKTPIEFPTAQEKMSAIV